MKTLLLDTASAETETLLLGCSLFSSFAASELSSLARRSETVDVDEGQVLVRQGEQGDDLFIIVSGSVRLSAARDGGLEYPVALLGPRSCFGEMAVLDGAPRSVTATAARPCRLLRVTAEALEHVFREHEAAREAFLREGVRLLADRLRSANERYWSIAGNTLKSKVEMAESRSRLLSLISHEFRTPLTVIKCSAQLLGRPGPVPHGALVEKILFQSARLEVLLDDLITLALLQAGARVGEMAEFDLARTAGEVAAEMKKAADAKKLRLRVSESEEEAAFVGDPILVRRAVRHLVDNAVRFSSAPGEITIETEISAEGCYRLRVRDQGRGIDGEAFARLLESFVQQQDPLNRDAEGLGIGLALANEVAKAHGGTLLMESILGSGSCFTLELGRIPESRSPQSTSIPTERNMHDV